MVAAANAAAGTNASAAAALVARGRESGFGEEVATGSARGDDDDGSAARTGGRNAAMRAHSSTFSSRMTEMCCYRWNYVSICRNGFDSGLSTATNPGMRLQRLDTLQLSRRVVQEVRR